jgi:hypothetical protein
MFHRRRAHSDDSPKNESAADSLDSRGARRTAHSRGLLTTSPTSDLNRGNSSKVPPGTCGRPPNVYGSLTLEVRSCGVPRK